MSSFDDQEGEQLRPNPSSFKTPRQDLGNSKASNTVNLDQQFNSMRML